MDGRGKQSDHLNMSLIIVIAHVNGITSYINICLEKITCATEGFACSSLHLT